MPLARPRTRSRALPAVRRAFLPVIGLSIGVAASPAAHAAFFSEVYSHDPADGLSFVEVSGLLPTDDLQLVVYDTRFFNAMPVSRRHNVPLAGLADGDGIALLGDTAWPDGRLNFHGVDTAVTAGLSLRVGYTVALLPASFIANVQTPTASDYHAVIHLGTTLGGAPATAEPIAMQPGEIAVLPPNHDWLTGYPSAPGSTTVIDDGYGARITPGSPNAVAVPIPEPTSATLAVTCAGLVLRRRRRPAP